MERNLHTIYTITYLQNLLWSIHCVRRFNIMNFKVVIKFYLFNATLLPSLASFVSFLMEIILSTFYHMILIFFLFLSKKYMNEKLFCIFHSLNKKKNRLRWNVCLCVRRCQGGKNLKKKYEVLSPRDIIMLHKFNLSITFDTW